MQSPARLHALFSPTQHGHGALWVAFCGTSRQVGWHLPADISADLLQDPHVKRRDMRLGGCCSPPTAQSTCYEQFWHCLEALCGYCSVLEMWNRIYMNSPSAWILQGRFCGCFSSITQCHCYWLCCLFLVGFLQEVILVPSHDGASGFMVCLLCDSQLFDLWDLFFLFLQVLIWCQKNFMLSKTYSSDVQQPKVLICNWQEGVFASTSSAFKK